jgi:hypothetical protein
MEMAIHFSEMTNLFPLPQDPRVLQTRCDEPANNAATLLRDPVCRHSRLLLMSTDAGA